MSTNEPDYELASQQLHDHTLSLKNPLILVSFLHLFYFTKILTIDVRLAGENIDPFSPEKC